MKINELINARTANTYLANETVQAQQAEISELRATVERQAKRIAELEEEVARLRGDEHQAQGESAQNESDEGRLSHPTAPEAGHLLSSLLFRFRSRLGNGPSFGLARFQTATDRRLGALIYSRFASL